MIWVPNYNNPLMDDRAVNTTDDDGNLTGDYEECNRDIATGISSGATALAAAQLGYQTGFCACMDWPKLKDLVKKDFTDPELLRIVDKLGDKNNGLCLGIDIKHNFKRTEVVKDNKAVLKISPSDKEINNNYTIIRLTFVILYNNIIMKMNIQTVWLVDLEPENKIHLSENTRSLNGAKPNKVVDGVEDTIQQHGAFKFAGTNIYNQHK